MKKRLFKSLVFIYFLMCFLCAETGVFAFGKKEVTEQPVLDNDWLLCVTNFDTSALPESRQAVGGVITRTLVDTLKAISYRIRLSPEYAYYEGYAWSKARTTAAKAVSAKQEERALQAYRGDANWKYKQNVKKIDADLAKLEKELAKVETEMPLINKEPKFALVQTNKEGTFPEKPKPKGERRFCTDQKADAFLEGTITEYYNRYFLSLKLFTVYTDSFVYEDDILFSPDDISSAVNEIAGRLIAALAGSRPAAVAIYADPPDTLVLINRNFAGQGTVEAHDRPPGTITIDLTAKGYKPETVEAILSPGELTAIKAALLPQEYREVNIDVPGINGVAVYQGAMYVGDAPLTLRLPVNQLNYVSVQTPNGLVDKIAFSTPAAPYTFSLKPKTVYPASEDRVNKARRAYYWSWGGTWIAGIAAWLLDGMVRSQTYGIQDGILNYNTYNNDFYQDTMRLQNISYGAWALLGAAVVNEIFWMGRYFYISTEDAVPFVNQSATKTK